MNEELKRRMLAGNKFEEADSLTDGGRFGEYPPGYTDSGLTRGVGGPDLTPSQDFFSGKKNTSYNAGTSIKPVPTEIDPRLKEHMLNLQKKAIIKRIQGTEREASPIQGPLTEEDIG